VLLSEVRLDLADHAAEFEGRRAGGRTPFGLGTALECWALTTTCLQEALDAEEVLVDHDSPWVSLVLHKALIVHRLCEFTGNDGQDQQNMAYWEESTRRLDDWVRAGAGSDDRTIRRALTTFQGPTEDKN